MLSSTVAKLLLLGVVLSAMGFTCFALTAMADQFVSYTVVNRTGESLSTWRMAHNCSVLMGRYDDDYSPAATVLPGQTYEYFSSAGSNGGCIQVATLDRRLVKVQKYAYHATVTVSELLTVLSGPIPPEDELPREPFWSRAKAFPPSAFIGAALLGLGLVSTAAGVGWAVQKGLKRPSGSGARSAGSVR